MNIDGIFKLIDAGFSADDIKKMYDEPTSEPAPEEPKDNLNIVADTVETVERNAAESGADVNAALMEQIKTMSATISGLTTTVKALQENNQKTATIPENSSKQTTEEIIKGFIENM